MKNKLLGCLAICIFCLPSELYAASLAESGASRISPAVLAVQNAAPSVVNISCLLRASTHSGKKKNVPLEGQESLGSGVFVSTDERHILTNAHVVEDAYAITIRLQDGRVLEAKLLGADPDFDLALLTVAASDKLPPAAQFSKTPPILGESVVAIGNPYGFSHSVSLGVISALHRSVRSGEHTLLTDLIQTDAAINPGNSGGPLINMQGDIAGITTAVNSEGQGISFAIPSSKAQQVYLALAQTRPMPYAWIGLASARDIDAITVHQLGLNMPSGLIVTALSPEGPAAKAGLRERDVILSLADYPVEDKRDYLDLMQNITPGELVTISFWREGKTESIEILAAPFDQETAHSLIWQLWGLKIKHEAALQQIVVQNVRKDSPAAKAGLKNNDIIKRIAGLRTANIQELLGAFRSRQFSEQLPIEFLRQKTRMRANLSL